MKENSFKKTEKALYNYKDIDIYIENIELQIDRLLNDVSVAGVSYDEKGGLTNAFNSVVENEVIKRDEHLMKYIDDLKKLKQDTISLKKSIANAIQMLNADEYKLVELRYFDSKKKKRTWVEIGNTLGIDHAVCCRMKNKIINKLAELIYPKKSIFNQF